MDEIDVHRFLVFFTFIHLCWSVDGAGKLFSNPSLHVRVKEGRDCPDSEAFPEYVVPNVTSETVLIEFTTPDFTHVTSLWDFRKEVQILRVTGAGEEERGDPQTQQQCFAIYRPNSDLLAPSSVARLRQKNPNNIKWAEEDKGTDRRVFEFAVSSELSAKVLSSQAEKLCSDSRLGLLLTEADFAAVRSTTDSNGDDDPQSNDVQKLQTLTTPSCKTVASTKKSCQCELSFCIPWYPCGWKLCKSKNHSGGEEQVGATFKCGIKSCRMCFTFLFQVGQKLFCMWDE